MGDTIWLARRYGPAARQIVAAVAAESHLVLMSPADFDRVRDGTGAGGCWSFVLRPERGAPAFWCAAAENPWGTSGSTSRTSSWSRR